ncbi:MAG: hypothetical protein G01um101431_1194 [Parcubacteria group bacterium Gr01-1014_31]|nr:MAG: hypothetical protein G01um101431_1194 [Parcubacteria group bacterium Gr01-1014_31]
MPKARRKSWAGSFIFWMTAVGIGMAAFFALLAVTTLSISLNARKVVISWQTPSLPTWQGSSVAATVPPQPFTNFQFSGFTFDNPGNWRVTDEPQTKKVDFIVEKGGGTVTGLGSENVTFVDTAGTPRAVMLCPVLETGYEAWNFTTEKRTFERDGETYTATFHFGEPTEEFPTAGQFALILAHPGTDLWENNDSANWYRSCQVHSAASGAVDRESFQRVFESLR